MNKTFVQQIKNNLLDQKKNLLIKSTKPTDIDTDGDQTDEIQANQLIELENQLGARDVAKIKLIDSALRKIEEDIYGLCEDCELPIPEKRLLINHCFLTCVFCAEIRENEENQKRMRS